MKGFASTANNSRQSAAKRKFHRQNPLELETPNLECFWRRATSAKSAQGDFLL